MTTNRSSMRKKPSLARPFVVTVAVGIPATLAMLGAGCGTEQPQAGSSGGASGSGGPTDDGSCSLEGAQRPCHLNLGMNGPYQTCFQGTQTCTSGRWSACGGDGMVTNSVVGEVGVASVPVDGTGGGGLHVLSHKGSCGDGACSATETCASCPADCGACPPGTADAAVPACTSDPCTPDCFGWGGTAVGLVPAAATAGVEVVGFGQIKNGMLQKLALDSCTGSKDCDRYDLWGTRSSYANCQMDTYCSLKSRGGSGCCEQFDTGGVYQTETTGPLDIRSIGTTGSVGFPDLTIGPGCSDNESDKYRYFPVCNRGSAAVPVGTTIWASYTNPNPGTFPLDSHIPGACTPATADCSIVLNPAIYDGLAKAVPGGTAILGLIDPVLGLLPGQCVLMDTEAVGRKGGGGNCVQPNGDKWIKINCDNGVNEGVLDPTAANTSIPPATPAQPTTPIGAIHGASNNWTDHSPDNNPPACTGAKDIVFQVQYHATTCPPGTQVVWNKLLYHTKTPKSGTSSSEIFFEAATAPEPVPPGVPPPNTFTNLVTLAEAKYSDFEGNNGNLTTSLPNCGGAPGCCASGLGSNQCAGDPENCTFVNPAAANTYKWFTSTNGPPSPATTLNPSACPKDIEDQFIRSLTQTPFAGLDPGPGKVAARQPWLNLRITLRGTADGKKTPTLVDWSVTYQCVASE